MQIYLKEGLNEIDALSRKITSYKRKPASDIPTTKFFQISEEHISLVI